MQKIKKAMILAAGFGTRLKPLTDSCPKALVKVNGVPMIEIVINKLVKSGIEDIIINTHHFADKMEEFFSKHDYGVKIHLIYENEILGTGGGIKNAGELLKDSGSFIVHNVDVDSEIDFTKMEEFHFKNSPLAALAVKYRSTKRPLIVDAESNVIGRRSKNDFFRYRKPVGEESYPGFCGVHIISTEIFKEFTEIGFFDIFTAYFHMISERKKILAYDVLDSSWIDLGKIEKGLHSV